MYTYINDFIVDNHLNCDCNDIIRYVYRFIVKSSTIDMMWHIHVCIWCCTLKFSECLHVHMNHIVFIQYDVMYICMSLLTYVSHILFDWLRSSHYVNIEMMHSLNVEYINMIVW
jgi:hypothetical protein